MAYLAEHPRLFKYLRFTSAYLLLFAFAGLGLFIIEWMRAIILGTCVLFKVDYDIARFAYTTGSTVLYLPYVLLIGLLEPYFYNAAKNSRVLAAARKVLIIVGGIGLVVWLVMQAYNTFNIPTHL